MPHIPPDPSPMWVLAAGFLLIAGGHVWLVRELVSLFRRALEDKVGCRLDERTMIQLETKLQ